MIGDRPWSQGIAVNMRSTARLRRTTVRSVEENALYATSGATVDVEHVAILDVRGLEANWTVEGIYAQSSTVGGRRLVIARTAYTAANIRAASTSTFEDVSVRETDAGGDSPSLRRVVRGRGVRRALSLRRMLSLQHGLRRRVPEPVRGEPPAVQPGDRVLRAGPVRR
jgi:hypothetical protein